MSGPLNIQPLGLLSFFDLKTGGRYPRELGEAIIPTLEQQFWLRSIASEIVYAEVTGVNAVNAYQFTPLGSATPIEVPNNELWYVDRFAFRALTLTAGDAFQARGGYGFGAPTNAGVFPVTDRAEYHGAATGLVWGGTSEAALLTPGSTFWLLVEDIVLGGPNPVIFAYFKIRRLRA